VRTLLLCCALAAHAVLAAPCPDPTGAKSPFTEAETEQRLKVLRNALDVDAKSSLNWRLSWGAAYGVGTAAQLIALPALGPDDRNDFIWGAVSTGVGVGFVIIATPDVFENGPGFVRKIDTSEHDCALLAETEALVAKDAANERDNVAWYNHLLNVAFNAGIGLVLGLGYGHWVSALINFLTGVAIGEGTIFTSPTKLADTWDQYLTGDLTRPTPSAIQVRPGTLGLSLALAF
jgi:hypothetical protein